MLELYKIANEYRRLADQLEAADTPEEMIQTIRDTMESLSFDFEDKAEAMAALIAEGKATIDACDKEIERLHRKIERTWAQIDSIKTYLQNEMEYSGIRKLKAGTWNISIAKNGGKAPIVWTEDPSELVGKIPELYVKTVRTVDTGFVRKALEEGATLDFAALGERGESLRIK